MLACICPSFPFVQLTRHILLHSLLNVQLLSQKYVFELNYQVFCYYSLTFVVCVFQFKYCYKVRWKGYGSDADTWQPVADLANVQDMIEDYKKERAMKQREKGKKVRLFTSLFYFGFCVKKIKKKKDKIVNFLEEVNSSHKQHYFLFPLE